eukprot:658123-Rhodomonas_salina.3
MRYVSSWASPSNRVGSYATTKPVHFACFEATAAVKGRCCIGSEAQAVPTAKRLACAKQIAEMTTWCCGEDLAGPGRWREIKVYPPTQRPQRRT